MDSQFIQAVLDQAECIYDLKTIEKALDEMAVAITQKIQHENPIVLSVMIGAMVPAGHLLTRLHFPLEVDYIHATRYRNEIRGGDLHWLVEPRLSLKDRTILLVDDVMDGGLTLEAIIDYCVQAGAKQVLIAVMINKVRPREPGVTFHPDFVGLEVENRFIFGFGLDYKGYHRNVPGIYVVAPIHEK